MNNIPYIHYFKDKDSLIKTYYIALIPLILFSFYKNGILLYINKLITFKALFIPIYFYFISIIVGILVSLIFKENKKNNILLCLIISLTISLNTNYLIYPIVLFIMLIITKYLALKTKISFNELALIRLFLVLSLLINAYSYLNIAEKLHKFNYNYFDIFLGFTNGGLASTSLFAIIISFIILSFNKFYKKMLPLMAFIGYLFPLIIAFFITKNNTYLIYLLNGHNYFSFIFLFTYFKIG